MGVALDRTEAAEPKGVRRSLRTRDVGALVDAACKGDMRAVSRLLSLVEDGAPSLRQIMMLLAPHGGHALVIGVTGSPGVGKSTSVNALVAAYRRRGKRVAVLAVDPSSPLSGGALLGDRLRMQDHTDDDGVYVRSMAARGHLGGLSRATPQCLRVLSAAGSDVVLVETVGVGQSEVAVAALADVTLVLLAPGMGDSIQAAKAGLLEVADVLVVNKADQPGADRTVRDLRHMLALEDRRAEGRWRVPVVRTVATEHQGYDEVLDAVARHADWAASNGEWERRRVRRAGAELEAVALAALQRRLGDVRTGEEFQRLAHDVAVGRTDPYSAADELIGGVPGLTRPAPPPREPGPGR